MGRILRRVMFGICLLFGSSAAADLPNENLMCQEPEPELDRFRFLRSVSLDINGAPPDTTWQQALVSMDDVPEAWIDEMLEAPGFADRVVRWHRALVWNNLSLVRLFPVTVIIRESASLYYVSGARAIRYRGSSVRCNDTPAQFGPNGSILTDENGIEGYVWVQPHWLPPGNQVKVCAFDAQAGELSANGVECGDVDGPNDTGCGCGPNLIYCAPRAVETAIQDAFVEDLNRRIRHVIENDLPYTKIFTSRTAFVNGPIVRYWKSLANFAGGVRNTPVPLQIATLPNLESWQTDEWVQIEQPLGHAGILTSPAWLLRFQTNRGRATQFYTQFLCSPFKAEGTLPTSDPDIQAEPDLQDKAGCNICHAVLEPASAYWGRWTEAGAGFLAPEAYPSLDSECYTCATTGLACSTDCNRYYLVKALHPKEEPYLGQLRWYLFQTEENQKNVEEGPALLALLEVARNRLPDCTARTAAERMLGRPVTKDEQGWIDDLVVQFAGSNFSYKALVKAIIMSPIYRRVK